MPPILWLVIFRSASGMREFYYSMTWRDALQKFGAEIGKAGELYARIRSGGKGVGSFDENLALLRTLAAEGFPRFDGDDAWPAWIVALPLQRAVPMTHLFRGAVSTVQADERWWASCVGGVVVDFQLSRDGARTVARNGHKAEELQQTFDANRAWVIVKDRNGRYQVGRGAVHYAEREGLEHALAYINTHAKPDERVLLVDLARDRICSLRPRAECLREEKISTQPASPPVCAPPPAPVATLDRSPASEGLFAPPF